MPDDHELLRRYANDGSEAAFGEVVTRYVNLVYSAALRRTNGDAHLAQDVAQLVFTDLARKARSLPSNVVVVGWLHRATRFAAAQAMRTERRRQTREQEAVTMNSIQSESAPDWERIRPLLDDALDELKCEDRDALLLRFMEQRSLAEVGHALGSNEDAARKRVSRALEKLRARLVSRGVTTTSAALSLAISANAIQIAPAGLATALTSASVATVAAGTGTTLTLLKIMAMTKPQLGVTALVLTGAAVGLIVQHRNQITLQEQTVSLREQIAQLQTENEGLSRLATQTTRAVRLDVPAPQLQVPPRSVESDSQSLNLLARLQHGEKAPLLTPVQAEKFLNENHRSAASLLAAFRATGDQNLLKEATEKFPNDPQVAFTAAYAPDVSAEERRHWLDAFKQSAPDNSLANYLSALDYFKTGQSEQAIQELSATGSKQKYQDYSTDFIQSGEEAYRSAGYPEAEARIIPSMSLLLPQFADLKQLNEQIINLAAAYRQAGDESSAQAALQMDATLGQRLEGPANNSLLSQLVGMSIETIALKQMDPNAAFGANEQTVKERLDQLTQRRTTLTQFADQLDAIYTTISTADWISYHDRWRMYGEENATRWLLDKYGQK